MFFREFIQDLVGACLDWRYWLTYGVLDARRIYLRTRFGMLWEMVGPGLFVYVIGFAYTRLMANTATEFLPHIALGYIIWMNMQLVISRGSMMFVQVRPQIISNPRPFFSYAFSTLTTSSIYSAVHLVVLVPVVIFYFPAFTDPKALIFFYYAILYVLTGISLLTLLGVLCLRLPDIKPLIMAVNRLAFFVTPIIWTERNLGNTGRIVMTLNPYSYYVSGLRGAVLGKDTTLTDMLVTLTITLILMLAAMISLQISRHRIPYWL